MLGFLAGAVIWGIPMGLLFGVFLGGRWLPGLVIGLISGVLFAAAATYTQFRIDKRNGLWD